tara:strand:+ start:593 stop:1024 length:432 start_codon:yes stop_codon:yes gene_type:complete
MISKLKNDLKNFILSKNKTGSNVVRAILSTITNEGKKDSANDEFIMSIIKKEIKKRKEAIKVYSANNRNDLTKIEEDELLLLQAYLPDQIPEEDLIEGMEKIKESLLSQGKLNMGELMKASMKEFSASADNSLISKIAKDLVN